MSMQWEEALEQFKYLIIIFSSCVSQKLSWAVT